MISNIELVLWEERSEYDDLVVRAEYGLEYDVHCACCAHRDDNIIAGRGGDPLQRVHCGGWQ